jgi:hypothetical protein
MKIHVATISIVLLSLAAAGCGGAPNRPAYDGNRCQDLLRQADALKGKPQQRSAVMQRYDMACRSNNNDYHNR